MSHQPIEPKYLAQMQDIGRLITKALNPSGVKKDKVGFALLVFDLGSDKGRMNYLSNAKREDMVVALKEFISNMTYGDDHGGTA